MIFNKNVAKNVFLTINLIKKTFCNVFVNNFNKIVGKRFLIVNLIKKNVSQCFLII
jgi:hypothetical protein